MPEIDSSPDSNVLAENSGFFQVRAKSMARRRWVRVLLHLIMIYFVSEVLSQHVIAEENTGVEWSSAGLDRRDAYRLQPEGLVHATAGQPLVLELVARDEGLSFGPDEPHPQLFAVLRGASLSKEDIECPVDYQSPGRYHVTVIGQVPGQYSLLSSISTSGIKMSFFDNPAFEGSPYLQRLSPLLKLEPTPDAHSAPRWPLAVRWEGAIRPGLSGYYSFTLEVDGMTLHEGACLKIASACLLQCNCGGSLPQHSVRLNASRMERLSLELVRPPQGHLRLWWYSPQLMRELVPAAVLHALVPLQKQSVSIRVVPGAADALRSTTSQMPSVLTAGRQTSVIIETRDKYGSLADDQSTMLVVTGRHEKEGVRHSNAVAARVDAGQFQASLVAHTVSGLLSLSSSLVHCSGIHATYFNAPDLDPATAVKATQAPGIDFSAQAGMTPPDSSLLAADPYSIRWAGMLHPLHAQQYTLYATRQTEKERVKMWVDNVLVIDMWSSLKSGNEVSGTIGFGAAEGHVYEIIVEYRSGSVEQSGLTLEWSTTGSSREIPILCCAQPLQTSLMHIIPGMPMASASEFMRCSTDSKYEISAGHQLCFRIVFRDEWRNLAEADMSRTEVFGYDQFQRKIELEEYVEIQSSAALNEKSVSLYFTVTAAGKFSAHVKVAGNDVIGSPQSVQVVAGKPSPSSWRYSGEALTLSSAGILSSFRVFSADEHGNTVSNAEIEFSGLYAVKSIVSGEDITDSSDSTRKQIVSITGGQIQLQYQVTLSAIYQAELSFQGKKLPGSPFTCKVLPGLVDAKSSLVFGRGLTIATVGSQSIFTITALDGFGNRMTNAEAYLDEDRYSEVGPGRGGQR